MANVVINGNSFVNRIALQYVNNRSERFPEDNSVSRFQLRNYCRFDKVSWSIENLKNAKIYVNL